MTSIWRKAKAGALLVPFVALLAACDNPVGDGDHRRPAGAQLSDRASGEVIATTQQVGGALAWDGSLSLEVGETRAVNVTFLDADGHPVTLEGGHSLRTRLATPALDQGTDGPAGIAGFEDQADHVVLTGLAAGETHLVLMVWHGSHADWSAPPLRVVVAEP